jgi:galactokinase
MGQPFLSSMSSDVATLLPPCRSDAAFVDALEIGGPDESPDREGLQEAAQRLLRDRLGSAEAPATTAFACGTVGVQADQTHYSDGFGLFLPLRQGVAVAARRASTTRITFGGRGETWSDDASSPPPWVVAGRRVLQELLADQPVEVAVESTVPGVCRDGYLAALAVALMRVVRALDVPTAVDLDSVQGLRDDLVPLLAAELGTAFNLPYSTGYLLATFGGTEPPFTLVDTTTREHLPVETEARTALRWAVVDPGGGVPQTAAFHRRRRKQAESALRVLRENGFPDLEAFRDLEHRTLEDAVSVLPEDLGPVARHLVTENRRVQKHVAAMRRADWQMIGALMLMSHASQRDQWGGTTPAADAVVEEAESRTHDGLYGACTTGRTGAVLVVGRPTGFGEELRRLVDAVAPRLDRPPRLLAP